MRKVVVAVVLCAGCTAANPRTISCPVVPQLSLPEVQAQIDEYIDSGRYESEFAAVVAGAGAWLEERAPVANRPAIVLDIDETSLSNWPAYRVNGWSRIVGGSCDLQQGPCGIHAWQAMGSSAALQPTLALVNRARKLDVAVFFISARSSEIREATERNLHEQGYVWDGVVLMPAGMRVDHASAFKAPERRRLADSGYTIILNMGDQQSDLEGGYAERTFKLPNPVYVLP